MAKKKPFPEGVCADYELLDSGVIQVARCFSSPVEPWQKGVSVPDYLSFVDHGHAIGKDEYKKAISREEEKLNLLVRKLEAEKLSLIVVFQGRDGAGKTGASKRIIEALDHDWRLFQIIPVGEPTDEEKNQPYMLRFFERDRMPEFGQVRVFDRSWAEDVLVVPVMKLASRNHVRNCYPEIRTMEWLLRRSRSVVVKIWLDITKEEQMSRFKKREEEKPWKYKESDVIARKNWDKYTQWGNRLFYWTGSQHAPWHIVPADDKLYSRVTCLRIIRAALEKELASPFRSM